jgi:hypothetical protein
MIPPQIIINYAMLAIRDKCGTIPAPEKENPSK